MPRRAQKPCRHPGCPALTDAGARCPAHATDARREYDRKRGTPAERGYDGDWRIVRRLALERDHYLCVICLRTGRPEAATEVDHILPIALGGARLDLANLQSLCEPCHSRKTAGEDGGFGNKRKRNAR